ncbi:MAG: hypothetical protein ABI760_04485 [Ferruginibacter sp.]
MNKKLFLIAAGFLFSIASYSQKLSVAVNYVTNDGTPNNNIIYYQPNQLLVWDDFRGKPVEGTDAVAMTSAGFSLKLAFRNDEKTSQIVINVNCSFSKRDSWVKAGNKTAYILNHEQKHFDIAYIHTLLFIQNLKNARFTNTNYPEVIERIHNETAAAMNKMQNQYDVETTHSKLPEKQAEWDEKISKQLAMSFKE